MHVSKIDIPGDIKIKEYDKTSGNDIVLFLDPKEKKIRRIIVLNKEEVKRIRKFKI